MRDIFKDPFIRFLILGGLLFAGYSLWQHQVARNDYIINIDPAEIERRALIFASENRRTPTDEDIQALTFAFVEETVLSREAKRLGLDRDDTIIERRLAQKMRFVMEGEAVKDPSSAELEAWFNENKSRFLRPRRIGFSHIFISPGQDSENVDQRAGDLIKQVGDDNWEALGDPFMLGRRFDLNDADYFTRQFGKDFSAALFALPQSTDWQGPIESALGLHIIRIDQYGAESQPGFETVKDKVLLAWRDEATRRENANRLRDLVNRYTVKID